jgi:hypothetical protein
MTRLTMPLMIAHDCEHVFLLKDTDRGCVEIALGSLRIDVYGTDGVVPQITVTTREDWTAARPIPLHRGQADDE